MKKLILLSALMLGISCSDKPNASTNSNEVREQDAYVKELTVRGETHEYLWYVPVISERGGLEHLPNCKYCINSNISRTELLLEGEELHEVWVITRDTVQITDHCDDCKYCTMQNPEGNPD